MTAPALEPRPAPVADMGGVPASVTLAQVAAGGSHSLALGSDGRAYAWGYNDAGELGDGTITSRPAPVPVDMSSVPPGVTFTRIAGGGEFSVALGSDGRA